MHRVCTLSILLAFGLFSITVSVLASPPGNTERKCSDGRDNDGDGAVDGDDSDCSSKDVCSGGGGGGGDAIVFPAALDVQWDSSAGTNVIVEAGTRPCTLSSNSATYASYHCLHVQAPSVFYELEAGIQTARKGDAAYCTAFVEGLDLNPNSSYQIDWDCRALPCTVRILNWAVGEEVQTKVPGADTVRLEAFADATPEWPAVLSPDTIDIVFKKDGTNKTAAQCLWNANLGNITFSQLLP